MAFGTDSFATNNALGGAFVGGTARQELQQSLSNGVSDGSISIVFTMPELTDLSGSNAPSLQIGILDGVLFSPSNNPASYSGTSDLDWWYFRSSTSVDAEGFPLQQISGLIANQVLDAGPGKFDMLLNIGTPARFTMWNTFVQAITASNSVLLQSANHFPPGHRPSENLDPFLKSFSTMNNGKLKGNVTAASLAAAPIPSGWLQFNDQNYTATNTMLDVIVGGLTTFGFIQSVRATQPGRFDPNAPVLGSGPPYRFSFDLTTKRVNTCRDKNNGIVPLEEGLNASAYSVYFQFTSDRVIALKTPSLIRLMDSAQPAPGQFQFAFTNHSDAFFTVLLATNIAQPSVEWRMIGSPTQLAPGFFQFTDFDTTNQARRFYRLRFP